MIRDARGPRLRSLPPPEEPGLSFAILGPLRIAAAGRALPVPPGRPQSLLVALLIGNGSQLPLDRLSTALWDEDPPSSARANLRKYATQLRQSLGRHRDRLTNGGAGYALTVRPGELDLHRWETLLAEARRAAKSSRPREAADRLTEALALWSGRAAEGVARRGPIGRRLDALDQGRWSAVEQLAQALLETGRHDAAVELLRPLLAEQNTREVAWHHLITALARAGDRGGALEAYTEARHALVTELGVEPGTELRELHHDLLHAEDPHHPSPIARIGTAPGPPAVRLLPPDPELVGRDQALRAIVDLLSEPGLVALHGPAGVGKSALAVRAAWELAPYYPDGQLYLDMYGSSPDLVPMGAAEAVASLLRALGAQVSAASLAEDLAGLAAALAGRRVVIVLDNVAHVAQVRRLLGAITGTAILITSRAMLATLDAGRQTEVDQLAAADAAALLTRYAGPQRVAAGPGDLRVLAGLCGHLALALRIVGARLASRPDWSLADMISRLADEQHRLDELAVDDLEVRTALALTCRTLTELPGGIAALELFTGWGVGAVPVMRVHLARALTGSTEHQARAALDRLAEVRLIEPTGDDGFRMHDLVRVYCLERARRELSAAVRQKLLARLRCHYVVTTRRARDAFRPRADRIPDTFHDDPVAEPFDDNRAGLAWLEAERANLVDVARRGMAENTPDGDLFAVRLIADLYPFLPMRGYYADWAELAEAGVLSARRIGSRRDEVEMLIQLGGSRARAGHHQQAFTALRTALRVAEEIGDPRVIALALDHLGMTLAVGGEPAEAREHLVRCAGLHRAGADASRLGVTLNNLSDTLLMLGDTATALAYLQESLELRRSAGDRFGIGITTLTIAQVYAAENKHALAFTWATDALLAARESGDREAELTALVLRAGLHRRKGNQSPARQDLEEALDIAGNSPDELNATRVRDALRELDADHIESAS